MIPLPDALRTSCPLNYDSPLALKAFLDARGLGMRKQFGQNFLINRDARRALLDALDLKRGQGVWEIGSGLGAMTWGLLERGLSVKAFERDPGFIRVLSDFFGGHPGFCLVKGDVLKTWPQAGEEGYLLGNLPYTIGSHLLGTFIERKRFFTRMVIVLQRELVRRMGARPGSKDYSSFSVLCTAAYTLKPLKVLKGSSFYPVPHVDSQGIRLDLRTDGDLRAYPPCFSPLVRQLFASRRKTLRHNLYGFVLSYILGKPERAGCREAVQITEDALERCRIPGNTRAEVLGPEDFLALAGVLEWSKAPQALAKQGGS